MSISFEVKQERGQDSLVTVEEDIITGWPQDKQILIFETGQSLHSNSDRAYNVMQAIKAYANDRGYQVQKDTEKYQVVAVYDEDHHSSVREFKLRQQIKVDPTFVDAAQAAKDKTNQLNQEYGRHITELKHLVYLLEQSLNGKLKEIAADLVETQKEIIATMDTEGIQDHHMFANRHPLVEIKPDHYYKLTESIPDDLDSILALLKSDKEQLR